jgi:hypothetical protein
MQDENDIRGFDQTPEGEAMIALLRRHAPPPPDVEHGRDAVLARLPRGRVVPLRWAASAVGTAAALLIAFLLFTQDVAGPEPAEPAVTPADVSDSLPRLIATVRGPSGDGWRVDAGLQDGLRVGDRLSSPRGEYTVTAVGIFDSRVNGPASPDRGEKLYRPLDQPAMLRAAALQSMGGDPAGFFSFGAVFDALPVVEARMLGIADGRALRVAETIPAVLRDFDAAPEPTLAARLGLRAGDVLISANGYLVADLHQLANALEWSRRSGEIQATVIRGSRTLELSTR